MYLLPLGIVILIALLVRFKVKYNWLYFFAVVGVSGFITLVTVAIDYQVQTTDTEVWSGHVVSWEHKEEWDEYHPPRTETYTTTDSKGHTTTHTRTIPGYWEHHYAQNHLKTSDNGWFSVDTTPDGRKMDDSFPNTTDELKEMWAEGTPSSSVHTYQNKVQASYSIYRHKNIDVKDYPDLPDYPLNVHDYINIDRIIGDVPNKEEALKKLNEWNTELNKDVPDPDKEGKTKSWKQVNLIFVNVGADKSEDYGFALQDKWEGGNKNDFVVSFSMNDDGSLNWVYPFSWADSESSELLKLEVRDSMMNLKTVNDFTPVVDTVAKDVADKFERKQFADFNYLQIDVSTPATVVIWVLDLITLVGFIALVVNEEAEDERYKKYRRMY